MCCVAGLQTARQFDSLPIWKLAMHQCRRFCRSAIRLNAIVHQLPLPNALTSSPITQAFWRTSEVRRLNRNVDFSSQ